MSRTPTPSAPSEARALVHGRQPEPKEPNRWKRAIWQWPPQVGFWVSAGFGWAPTSQKRDGLAQGQCLCLAASVTWLFPTSKGISWFFSRFFLGVEAPCWETPCPVLPWTPHPGGIKPMLWFTGKKLRKKCSDLMAAFTGFP